MGPEIYISVTGDTAIEKNLNAVARNLEPAQMMKTFEEIVIGIEEYEKESWGRGIKTLPDTRVRWPESKTLDNTGALKESMTDSQAPGAIRVITPFGFEYGTSIPYARFVNDGTSRQAPKPFFKVNAPIRALIRTIMIKRIMRTPDARFASGFRD